MTTTTNIASKKSLKEINLVIQDYWFIDWELCGFTVWSCMTGVYLGVYSVNESSGYRIESVYIIWGHEFIFLDKLDDWWLNGWLCVKCYLCVINLYYMRNFLIVNLPFFLVFVCFFICDDQIILQMSQSLL